MKQNKVNPDETKITQSDLNVKSIPLYQISQKENSRITYDEGEMTTLMVSMKQTGQLQPIGVRRLDQDQYEVIFGNRRFSAAKKLGWKTIDCSIFETPDQASNLIANATENMVRADVSLPEQGRIFHLLTQRGLTLGEIAARVSVPRSRVDACLKAFNKVPVKFRNKISHGDRRADKRGKISGATAVQILNLKGGQSGTLTKADTEKIFTHALKKDFNVASIKAVGSLVSQGRTVEEALAYADQVKSVTVEVWFKKSVIQKLEKEYQMSMPRILRAFLKSHKELELEDNFFKQEVPEKKVDELF